MTTEKHNRFDATPIERFDLEGQALGLESDAIWASLERGGFARSDVFRTRVEELLPLGRKLIRNRALGRIFLAKDILPADLEILPTPIREAADYYFFGICTAGREIDEQARALCEAGELIDSMILDAIAMTGLSLIGDQLGRAAFDWARDRGLSASRSFSPGAGASGWEIKHQRFLFDFLPEEPLGVELTPHFLMRPLKSVSFIIGIGSRVKQAKHPFLRGLRSPRLCLSPHPRERDGSSESHIARSRAHKERASNGCSRGERRIYRRCR